MKPSKTYLEIGEYKSPKLMKPSANDLVSSVFVKRDSWVDKLSRADRKYIQEVIVAIRACSAPHHPVADKLIQVLGLSVSRHTVALYLKAQLNAKK